MLTNDQIERFVLAHPDQNILGMPVGSDRAAEDLRRRNAFLFCNQVCLDLRAQNVPCWLLLNPNHTNVEGFAADIIVLQDGNHYDIVNSSESEAATPSWHNNGPWDPENDQEPSEPRADLAIDRGPVDPTEPTEPTEPPIEPTQNELVRAIVALVEEQARTQQMIEAMNEGLHNRIGALMERIELVNDKLAAATGSKGFTGTLHGLRYVGSGRIDLTPKA